MKETNVLHNQNHPTLSFGMEKIINLRLFPSFNVLSPKTQFLLDHYVVLASQPGTHWRVKIVGNLLWKVLPHVFLTKVG